MKYITTLNTTITEWENNNPILITQLAEAFLKLFADNGLSTLDYKCVLGWTYEKDDYVKNRITLVLEAQPVGVNVMDNYKDVQ